MVKDYLQLIYPVWLPFHRDIMGIWCLWYLNLLLSPVLGKLNSLWFPICLGEYVQPPHSMVWPVAILLGEMWGAYQKLGSHDVTITRHKLNWLVVSTPLKNISPLGWSFPIYGKMQKCSKPPIRQKDTKNNPGWMAKSPLPGRVIETKSFDRQARLLGLLK